MAKKSSKGFDLHSPETKKSKFVLSGLTQSIAAEDEGKNRSFAVSTDLIK